MIHTYSGETIHFEIKYKNRRSIAIRIGVVFESEPEVTYDYWVESKDNIYQISFLTNKRLEELEHVE
ncbi:hypothetical protein M3936_22535 [Sutcliffiella horikoshii]|uniref:hypothetical protein n=1 Tax=Sutcliffiella horikoshii TaxID=79883 RepID=UPI00203D827D|nr:hypothetical protein [Sutcliffiella horikoshii]MCM3620337.1 hypothetical protein [Sutcliffiella horikoshii]